MRSAVKKRIKVTKNGKMLKRTMGLGHFRTRKGKVQMKRKAGYREITTEMKNIIKTS